MAENRDTPIVVAHAYGAPAPERQQALTELQKAHMPSSGQLMLPEHVERLLEFAKGQLEDDMLLRAHGGAQIIQFPGMRGRSKGGAKSVMLDEYQISVMGDYFDKPGTIQFDAMRAMVEQTPVLNAVIMNRIRDVCRFANPQESDDGPGFRIMSRDRAYKLNKDEQKEAAALGGFIANCGWEANPRRRRAMKRDNFRGFLAKAVRDTLQCDSMPIETEFKRDRGRGMDGFYAVDGTTIRLCLEEGYEGDDSIYALQVVQGRVVTAYTLDDLIYEVRNPRADVRLAGYGMGETELLIKTVTGFLNAMTLNMKGFTDNAIPKGILHLVGDFAKPDMDAFKRYWNAMLRGVNNAFAMPVLAASNPDSAAHFEKIDSGFDEMYFSKWMTFLVSIICAIYGMSPEEINFESFTNKSSSLSGNDTEEKLAKSTDKGLRPLMGYLESTISDYIISDFGDKYVFRWAGLEEQDAEKRHEMRKLLLTVGEAREEENYPPLKDETLSNCPLNSALQALYMQNLQQQQQQAGGQGQLDFGEGGEQGGEGGGGPQQADEPGGAAPPAFGKSFPPVHRLGWS